MVIVCGDNMGDIFRRNAFNLGLEVVQCPDAVADARDGDEFSYRPEHTRQLTKRHAGQGLHAVRVDREGGRDPSHGRHLRRRTGRVSANPSSASPRSIWPDAATAAGLTTTEQIVWAHRVDKDAEVEPGRDACVSIRTCCRHPTARRRFRSTRSTRSPAATRSRRARLPWPTITSCLPDANRTTGKPPSAVTSPGWKGSRKAVLRRPGRRHLSLLFPRTGPGDAGQFIPGADSHSRAYGAYGAIGIGVGSTTLGFGWSTGYVYFTLARARRVAITGTLATVGQRQGHRAQIARTLGRPHSRRGCPSSSSTLTTCSCRSPTATRFAT